MRIAILGRFARRALKPTALAVGAILIACALVYALRWRIFGSRVRAAAASAIEGIFDAEVVLSDATGSIVTSVELRDVRVFPREGSPLAAPGRIARLRASWSLLGRVRGVEAEGVDLVLKAPSDPARPWDEALGDVLGRLDRLDEPLAIPAVTFADVRVGVGATVVHLAAGQVTPAERGFEARASLHEDELDVWDARSREVRLCVGGPAAALEAEASCVTDDGAQGLSLSLGRADERGVRLLELQSAGATPPASFAGRLAPLEGYPTPAILSGMLRADALPAEWISRATGLRGLQEGAVSLKCVVRADLRPRMLELDVTASSSAPVVVDAGALVGRGSTRLSLGELRVVAHAEGPMDGGPAGWTVHPLDVTVERADLAGVPVDKMDAITRFERGRLTVEHAGLARGTDRLDLAGPVDPFARTGELTFALSASDLAPYLKPFARSLRHAGPFAAEGRIEADEEGVRVFAEAGSRRGRLVLEGDPGIDLAWERLDAGLAYGEGVIGLTDVRVRRGPGGLDYSAEAAVVPGAARGEWKVASCVVRAGPDNVELSGRVGPGGTADLDITAAVELPPRWLPENVASLMPARGRAGLAGTLEVRPGAVEVRGDIDAAGIDIAGVPFETAGARATFRRRSPRGEPPVFEAEIKGLALESGRAELALAVDVLASSSDGRHSVELFPTAMTLRGDEVFLPERIVVRPAPGGEGGTWLEPFEASWRGLDMSAEGELSEGAFRAGLSARSDRLGQALRPEETGLPEVEGAGHIDAYFAGSREEGSGVVWAEAKDLSAAGFPLGRLVASALLEWPGRESRASISPEAELSGPHLWAYFGGALPLGEAEAGARVDLDVAAEVTDLAAFLPETPVIRRELGTIWNAAEFDFLLTGTVDDAEGKGQVGLRREARPLRVAALAPGAPPRIPFTYSDGAFSFGPAAILTPWGGIEVGGDLPLRLVFEPYPSLAAGKGPPTLRARFRADDVGALGPFMTEAVRRLRPSGRLSAAARLEGVFPDLEPLVDLALRDGSLSPPAPVAPVEGISLDATLRDGRIDFGRIAASMGHGAIEAGGTVSVDDAFCSGFDVKGRDVLLVGGDELPVRLRADLDVRIEGDREGARVTGSAAVTSASYSAEFPTGRRGPVPEDPRDVLAAFGIDLPLAPEGGVALPGTEGLGRFSLDIETTGAGDMRIENSLVGALVDFRVRLRGTGAEPSASGTVSAERGEVRVYPGIFLPIDEFRLDIPPEPDGEPAVVFSSSAMSGLTRVFIDASGPLSRPTVTLYSEPPYPREDLVMLLAFGQAPGTPARPERALVSPAARVLSGIVGDRFPRADPAASPFWKLRLALGTEAEYPTELVPLPEPALPDRGLVLRAEYLVTDYLSVLTEQDELGDIGADFRLRFRWPRREDDRLPAADAPPPEGPVEPTTYTLVGNRQVGSRRISLALEPEFKRSKAEGWTPARLSDAAYRVRRLYRDLGHHFARVSAGADDGWAVFWIEEGPLVRLGEVRFRGNSALAEAELREALFAGTPRFVTTPFSRRLAAAQADSVRMHYAEQGFLAVRVGEPELEYVKDDRRMNVTVPVEEGPRFVLGEVAFTGAPASDGPRLDALVSGDRGAVLGASLPHRLARKVRDHYREQGRPEARCSPRLSLDPASGTGRLELEVFPARRAKVGAVKVKGNSKATVQYVERLVGLEPGEPLAASKLRAAEQRLIDTRLFRSVRLVPLWPEGAPGTTPGPEDLVADVEARVEEAPHLEAALIGGYGTFDGFRVGVDIGTRNAFGHGERLHAGAEVSEQGFRALGEAKFPCGARRASTLTLTGIFESREQKSFEADYFGFSPSISCRVAKRDEFRAGVRFDSIRTTEVAPGVPPGDLLDYENIVPFVTVLSDRRDRYINPHGGHVLAAQIEGSSSDLGSDVSYTRISAFMSGFVPLTRDSTLALSLHGGVTQPQKDTEVLPIALRYFAGGIGTVRGIPDRELGPMVGGAPTGGEVFLATTAELRFRIWRSLFGAAFADIGQVYATTGDVDLEDARTGYGFGLRYLTPAGFVVVDIGFNADPLPGEDDNIVYLTFGLPF
ncbi:MAG: translocation/assembly module TamB domain-containing protein [Planctomycetota bacterium]